MIIIMSRNASAEQVARVQEQLRNAGFGVHLSQGVERTVIGAIGDRSPELMSTVAAMAGVERVVPVLKPFKLASKDFKPESTRVKVGEAVFGGEEAVLIAGPCAIENEEQLMSTAEQIKAAGGKIIRGGAFKPRTSPYSFQGLKAEGLKLIQKVAQATGLAVVSEVVSPYEVELVAQYVQMLQIGARNMQNFALLQEVGRTKLPVLLKRGMAATIEEWLMAAEYIMKEGNYQVVLCERGIRTFETATRNTMDVGAIALVKEWSHLPVIADPSHASGRRDLVIPLARAALAAGADGLMVEVHPKPETALSDGPQSLDFVQFQTLVKEIGPVLAAMGRHL
ncbi:MAG TPA: 3-deoxy-7-phosphoheptulonate synthase [Firmicutes bacterium]|uniref:3-deoxy-7-phosphoheptulonate synthase n=1 Tax=Capillibacterium thermochitinicola TaxID=2699427 RepID=A0A8J6HQJ9_9FIRM|nr:3-deoxy-7-phosphoheptulonate synthase [Capillibacterium thermochitinicola]MBA2132231.1 3-deoxy-7-phosphoheptulonate synthase [Capillibacterium thermochitinicola]HHW12897.1 3-deoxy-7-phosphoheptulonate synthase [Bacillota bacterium]